MYKTISIIILFLTVTASFGQTHLGTDGKYYDQAGHLFSGIYSEYYPDSLLRMTVEVSDGKPDGFTTIFFENGQVEEIRSFKNGLMDGKWEKWNRENIKIAEAGYKENKKEGKWYIWDDHGILRYDMTYEAGKKKGNWFMFNENGELINQKNY